MNSIDSVGTRLIVATDSTGNAAIPAVSVATIAGLEGIAWAFGLGPATDVRNADLPQGSAATAMRPLIGSLPAEVTILRGRLPKRSGEAIIGVDASAQLQLTDAAGVVVGISEDRTAIVGEYKADGALSTLNKSLLSYADSDWPEQPTRYIYALADRATQVHELVAPVSAAAQAGNPTAMTVETSSGALELRRVLAGHLGTSSRQLMAIILSIGLVLVMITTFGAVSGRRRDFGRRRALGASRSAIVALILIQNAAASLVGATIGVGFGQGTLWVLSKNCASLEFTAAVAMLVILVALIGSAIPAIAAANRDPVRILRVP